MKNRHDTERRTIQVMIGIYCRSNHQPMNDICEDCEQLYKYAVARLDKCPFGQDKPTCQNCTVHCYQAEMRERARTVMRFAGPRMLWRHPVLTWHHLRSKRRDKRRKTSRSD